MAFLLTALLESSDRDFMLWVYNEYARLMFFTARQFTAELDIQNDVVQDSLLHLTRNISTLRRLDPLALSTYIVTTVKNAAIDFLKKEKQIQEHTVELDDESVANLESPDPALDDLMGAIEDRERLISALERLPDDERFLLERKYFLNYSDKELARSFKCKPGSIRMKLTRARRHMLSILQSEEYSTDD